MLILQKSYKEHSVERMDNRPQEKDEIEINLMELFGELWSKAGVIILSGIVLALLAILGSKLLLTPKYESTTTLYVLTKQDSNTVTSSDMQVSTLMTQDYAELIKSRQVTETVIAQLGLDMTHEEMLSKMSISVLSDTRIVGITVTNEDPYMACEIADSIREAAAVHIQNVMAAEAVNVVDVANVPEEPSSPSVMKNGVIGGMLGVLIAAAVILITFLTNDTIKNSEDVERYLQLSTLGVVPLAEGEEKGKKKTGKKR